MARTKAFDVDETLDRAVDLFWRRGYAATSMNDLVEYLGINRGSLYATFESKSELYERVLERYTTSGVEWLTEQLADTTVPLRDRLQAVLTASAVSEGNRGCLLLNTATECNGEDPRLRAVTTEKTLAVRNVVFDAITEAQGRPDDRDRLVPGVTPAQAADLMMALMHGLRGLSTFDNTQPISANASTLALNSILAPVIPG